VDGTLLTRAQRPWTEISGGEEGGAKGTGGVNGLPEFSERGGVIKGKRKRGRKTGGGEKPDIIASMWLGFART